MQEEYSTVGIKLYLQYKKTVKRNEMQNKVYTIENIPSSAEIQNLQVFLQATEVYLSLSLQNIGQCDGSVT